MSHHRLSPSSGTAPSESVVARVPPTSVPRGTVTERHPASELLELCTASCLAPDFERAAQQLASGLASFLSVESVVLGIADSRGRTCRVAAVVNPSDTSDRDLQCRIEGVLDETLQSEGPAFEPSADDGPTVSPLTLRALASHWRHMAFVAQPLGVRGQRPIGAILLARSLDSVWPPDLIPRLTTCGQVLGALLPVLRQSHQSPWRRLMSRAVQALKRRRLVGFAVGVVAICLVLSLPRPYQISCPCTLEPVVRRFVVAPFAGRLDEGLVQPGERVTAGQLLAKMDAREVELELAGLEAERDRAETRHEASLATRAATAAQLARLEVQQHDLRIRTLANRREQLHIRSPIDGVVVRGNLDRSAGTPLSVGQSLFEVAPLERMIAEIAVPEREISQVEEGCPVELRLDATPRRAWTGRVSRIHPRSELRDGNSVFVAEVELENHDGSLSPGMRGTASLTGPNHPLGWNLFHHAADRAIAWLGW